MKKILIRSWCQRSFVKKKVVPEGFFPVYVGPDKQWFAVKTKYANHPLFQMLLEDAQVEYGYNTPGPILLPCEVDLFYRVVGEIEAREMEPHGSCGFGYGLFSWFDPSRRLVNAGDHDQMGKGYGSYGVIQLEYGYNTPGPILLPCEVDLFYRVVGEIEAREMEPHGSCGFGYGLFSWFDPSRRLVNAGDHDQMGKGYGSYGVLTPSRLVKS